MLRQLVYCVRIPDKSRAISRPRRRPDTTIDSDVALRRAGARSPTRGSMSCGVTVVKATMKDSARKTEKDFVRHRPSHFESQYIPRVLVDAVGNGLTIVAVRKIRLRTNARRRTMSPRGHRKSKPDA